MDDDSLSNGPFNQDPFIKFHAQLEKVVDDDRSLVLITNGFLELLVETLIKAKCKNHKKITGDSRSYPYSSKLLILNEIDAISEESYLFLDGFRKIRNDAAHNPFFALTDMAVGQLKGMEGLTRESFPKICIYMVGAFWNRHYEIFAPVFLPGLTEAQRKLQETDDPASV